MYIEKNKVIHTFLFSYERVPLAEETANVEELMDGEGHRRITEVAGLQFSFIYIEKIWLKKIK